MATAVSALADLLDSCGVAFWGDRLRNELDGLRVGDELATKNLRSFFGGMGNLDDRIITPLNGDRVTASQGQAATRQLWQHFEEIRQAGLPIQRNWPADTKEANRKAKGARKQFDRRGANASSSLDQWENSVRSAGFYKDADGFWTRPLQEGAQESER